THPILSGPATQRISASSVKEIVVTDSVPIGPEKHLDKVTVLSLASLLGEAIRRIHTGSSIGDMFQQGFD
ncbi:MAG: ribose-phosphate diphosphokinase, partial [Verrucomicrobiota bacterium]|nr:ribose-phosphate diphosphokinase [Verrucomicrobiota bacterium]